MPSLSKTEADPRPGRTRPSVAARVRSWVLGLLPAAVILALLAWNEWLSPFPVGYQAAVNLRQFLVEMLQILPAMFVLVGLFDIWVPRKVIERHVGRSSGPMAVLWMILLAMLQAGPLYAAFPVAIALWRKGTAPRNVFIYLGAFAAAKIPMLTFEVGFLGWQFSLARTAFTLPVFIVLGYLLERMLPPDYTPPLLESLEGTPPARPARQ